MIPKVSVIVPVYNSEKHLKCCIEAILEQSYSNIELILVNDCSTDNSGNICDEYNENHPNVKVVHRKISGGSAGPPRNSGLELASGQFIAFIDSDDWIHPDFIGIMLQGIRINTTDIVECDLIETRKYFIKSIEINETNKFKLETRLTALKRIIKNQRFSVCVRMYNASLIKNIRFPENVISEDVYFTLEVMNNINKITRINMPLYYYRVTPNSVTRKPYSLKYFDTLNSGLHLQKELECLETDKELLTIVKSFILTTSLYHYKMLNYHPSLDLNYVHRKKLKEIIRQNLSHLRYINVYTIIANILSIPAFEKLISLNKFRHKIFQTNTSRKISQ